MEKGLPLYRELETAATIAPRPCRSARSGYSAEGSTALDTLLKKLVSVLAKALAELNQRTQGGLSNLRTAIEFLPGCRRQPAAIVDAPEARKCDPARSRVENRDQSAPDEAVKRKQAEPKSRQALSESGDRNETRQPASRGALQQAENSTPGIAEKTKEKPAITPLQQASLPQAMHKTASVAASPAATAKEPPKAVQGVRTTPAGTIDPNAPGSSSDPQAVLAAFNKVRAERNLPPVSLNDRLNQHAGRNNEASMKKGLGHHVPLVFGAASGEITMELNPAIDSAAYITQRWLDSPPHRAILLSPHQRTVGIDTRDRFCTAAFNDR